MLIDYGDKEALFFTASKSGDTCLVGRRIQSPKVDDSKTISIPDDLPLQGSGSVKLHDQAFGHPPTMKQGVISR
jgi:hypothetical protein